MSQHEATIARALSLPGVTGLHLMPLTKRGRLDTMDLVQKGKLSTLPRNE
jgi:hypothetical protein